MAFSSSGLVLWSHGNDKKLFRYDSDADTMATINTAGYFKSENNLRMAVGDLVYTKASNTTAVLQVTAVSSVGAVTTKAADSVEYQEDVGYSTGTGAAAATGITNLTSSDTVTINLGLPFAGARKSLIKTSTSTTVITVNSGSTAVTFDGSNQNLTFDAAGEAVILAGLSTTRWGILSNQGTVGTS